jgi:hypothetical protein
MYTNNNLVEVFRCVPLVGKNYYHAEYDESTGKYPYTRYFVKESNLRLVGEFIKITRTGYSDGGQVYGHFMLDGREVIVNYNYEGKTCFLLKN